MDATTCTKVEYLNALLNENLTQIITNMLTAQNKMDELEKIKHRMQSNEHTQKFINSLKNKKINNLLSCIELGTHMLIYKANELRSVCALDQSNFSLVGDASSNKLGSKLADIKFSHSTNMIRSMQEQQKKIFQNETMKIFAQRTKQIEAEENLLHSQKTSISKNKPPLPTNRLNVTNNTLIEAQKLELLSKPVPVVATAAVATVAATQTSSTLIGGKSNLNKIDIRSSLSSSISTAKKNEQLNIEKETENFLQAMLDHGQEKVAEEFLKQYIKQLNNPIEFNFKVWLQTNFSLSDDESDRVSLYIQTWYLNCKLEQFDLND